MGYITSAFVENNSDTSSSISDSSSLCDVEDLEFQQTNEEQDDDIRQTLIQFEQYKNVRRLFSQESS